MMTPATGGPIMRPAWTAMFCIATASKTEGWSTKSPMMVILAGMLSD